MSIKITTYYCPSCIDAGSGEIEMMYDCEEDKYMCEWCENVYLGNEARKIAKSRTVEIDD